MCAQFWVLSVFLEGSKRDTSDGEVDVVYTWKCTRDQDTCFDTSDLDWRGWLAFSIMMVAHLLKDAINGIKMIKHSAKQRHSRNSRILLFVGGTLLTMITVFTVYVSTIYNNAIATSKLRLFNMFMSPCQSLTCLLLLQTIPRSLPTLWSYSSFVILMNFCKEFSLSFLVG